MSKFGFDSLRWVATSVPLNGMEKADRCVQLHTINEEKAEASSLHKINEVPKGDCDLSLSFSVNAEHAQKKRTHQKVKTESHKNHMKM